MSDDNDDDDDDDMLTKLIKITIFLLSPETNIHSFFYSILSYLILLPKHVVIGSL